MTDNDDLRERVARAIFSTTSEWTQSRDSWADLPEYGREVFLDRAQAALSATPIEALQQRVERLEGALREIHGHAVREAVERERERCKWVAETVAKKVASYSEDEASPAWEIVVGISTGQRPLTAEETEKLHKWFQCLAL